MSVTTIRENKCGVVILNYNSHDLTVALANKIATYYSVDEICVVDNCSKDDFDNDFSDKKIFYIKNHVNSGYSAGNNVGLRYLIEEKHCEYVFIANPDTIFEDKTISEIKKTFEQHPKIALASTKRYGHGGATIHQYFDFPNVGISIKSCFFVTRKKIEKERFFIQNKRVDEADGLVYVDAVPGAFFGIKSEFLIKNNYIYEGIFLYGEEIILGRQAKLLGYKSAIINTSSYIHDHQQLRFNNRKMFWRDRKSLKVYYKMFEKLSSWQWFCLNAAFVLGTIEYNCEYFLFHLLQSLKQK